MAEHRQTLASSSLFYKTTRDLKYQSGRPRSVTTVNNPASQRQKAPPRRKPVAPPSIEQAVLPPVVKEQHVLTGPRAPAPLSRWSSVMDLMQEWWIYEIHGLLLSALGLVAIDVVLGLYDHKEQPTWEHLSLNTAETFVAVHWQWLALPVLVWILTAITWIGAAVLTARARLPKLRSDVIPLLFLYRDDECKVQTGAASGDDTESDSNGHGSGITSSVFALRAQGIQARLVIEQDHAKLV